MGGHWIAAHDPKRAIELLQRARDILIEVGGPDDPSLPVTYNNMAIAYLDLQRWQEAIDVAKESQRILEQQGPDTPALVGPLTSQAKALRGEGKPKDALPILERAVRIADAGKTRAEAAATARITLARALIATHGDAVRARTLAADARAAYVTIGDEQEVADIDDDFPRSEPSGL
jgi:tetratricopeptide (TPR) repeat protein